MDAARDGLREAVERDPNNARARNDLAVVLCLQGRYAEAHDEIVRAVAIDPALTGAYVNGAVIAECWKGPEAVIPWIRAARAIEPHHLAAMLIQGSTLAKLDRADEAIELCRSAIAVHGESAPAYEVLGLGLHTAGRSDEAVAAFARAQSLAPPGLPGVKKAVVLLECGRQPEALAELDAVLRANPMLAVGWYVRALALDFQLGALDVAAMENVLREAPSLSHRDRVQLHLAIGRAQLAGGDPARGFDSITRANGMYRESIAYRIETDEEQMRATQARFSAELIAAGRPSGDPSETPIFVIGMPRSGSSLIEQILASHPSVFGGGELSLIMSIGAQPDSATPEGIRRGASEYLAAIARRAPGFKRVVDKMPFNFLHAGLIAMMLPNARIIYCRRDPLDTCLSCYLTLFESPMGFTYDQGELGRFYGGHDNLMKHWRNVLPRDRYFEIAYENVVADLEGQARALLDFCGLPWDDRCLSFHRTSRVVHTASMNQVRRPIYATSVGRAKDYAVYLEPLIKGLAR